MQQEKNLIYPSNALGQFWMKIPLIVRSILLGFGVSSIGIGIWLLLATTVPAPWSVIGMVPVLIIYWLYFSGKWNPTNTRAFRSSCFRKHHLKKNIWIWGLTAGVSIFLFVSVGMVHTFRMVEFQPDVFKTARFLNDFPAWQAWLIIVMGSMVAGICEEIGYRGYLQAPLEKKYGPIVSISITSVVFVIIHLHQAWASGILVQIFVISFMIGYLAYASKSLIPGIIAHVSFDIINFSYWWSDVAGTFERKPISITGVDTHYIVTVSVVLLSVALFIISIRKLMNPKKQTAAI